MIAGGHTIQDKEPKIGLVALGFAEEDRLLRKDGLNVGDRLVLTKPLGFGVTTTALKQQQAPPEDVEEVVSWMKKLNRGAAALAGQFKLRASTDVTGFSFLGHAWEMASGAGVGMHISFKDVPFVSCAKKHAAAFRFPGGASDNMLFYNEYIKFDAQLLEEHRFLLFDPQTSGGLLLGVPQKDLDAFMTAAQSADQPAWVVGEVVPGDRIRVDG